VLLDGGRLTDLRTAAAGAVAAKYLAPPDVRAIGIIGAGIQARLQADLLRSVTTCRRLVLFARRGEAALTCAHDLRALGFEVELADSPAEVASHADLIITTTPSRAALLNVHDVRPGTHVTAVGADTPGKQELDPQLIASADLVAVDDRGQCETRGELQHALPGSMHQDRIITLGAIVAGYRQGRTSDTQITVADLTGVATQDIEIATAVLAALDHTGAP
jgi:ornithine cyclodeaminase